MPYTAVIPEERIENAGQAAGQRDDGDVLARRAAMRRARSGGFGCGGPAAQDREARLE